MMKSFVRDDKKKLLCAAFKSGCGCYSMHNNDHDKMEKEDHLKSYNKPLSNQKYYTSCPISNQSETISKTRFALEASMYRGDCPAMSFVFVC